MSIHIIKLYQVIKDDAILTAWHDEETAQIDAERIGGRVVEKYEECPVVNGLPILPDYYYRTVRRTA